MQIVPFQESLFHFSQDLTKNPPLHLLGAKLIQVSIRLSHLLGA